MKISLLNKREPFNSLFTSTIKEALSEIYCMPFKVILVKPGSHDQRARPDKPPFTKQSEPASMPANLQLPAEADNEWICNGLLNAIYARSAEAPVRRATRGRYGNAPNNWRRMAASTYVHLSTCRFTEKLLAPAVFRINPAPPGASMLLFRGGLNRIKLFDYRLNTVHVMPKLGTPQEWIDRELTMRAQLPTDFPAPHIFRDFTWHKGFREELIPGITLDQIRDASLRERASEKVAFHMGRLAVDTERQTDLNAYLEGLNKQIGDCLGRRADLSEELGQRVRQATSSLLKGIRYAHKQASPFRQGAQRSNAFSLCMSHGDLQDDNILWTGENLVFTDWECIQHRQIAHDAIHYMLQAHRAGFGLRLHHWIEAPAATACSHDDQSSGLLWLFTGGARTVDRTDLGSQEWRHKTGLLFLLEKLVNHAESATSPVLFKPGDELASFMDEIDSALGQEQQVHEPMVAEKTGIW